MNQISQKLGIRENRICSETLKKQKIKDLVNKRITLSQVVVEHQVSRTNVHRWLYRLPGSACTKMYLSGTTAKRRTKKA